MTGSVAPKRSAARRQGHIASRAEAAPFPPPLFLAKAACRFLTFASPERVSGSTNAWRPLKVADACTRKLTPLTFTPCQPFAAGSLSWVA